MPTTTTTTMQRQQQRQQQQLVTEEWMMMNNPPNHHQPHQPQFPTFLEIMFLNDAEQYMYTTVVRTLIHRIQSDYIQPLLQSLLQQQQQQQSRQRQSQNSNIESIPPKTTSTDTSLNWSHNTNGIMTVRIQRLLRYLRQYSVAIGILIVSKLNIAMTNNSLEIIYLVRYIMERYALVGRNNHNNSSSCTLVESLYGGGGITRKKVVAATAAAAVVVRDNSNTTTLHNNNNSINTRNSQQQRFLLQPLTRNDQIRTALIPTILGYVHEKLKQLVNANVNENSSHTNSGNSSIHPATNSTTHYSNILFPVLIALYQACNIYHQYQYFIGMSQYSTAVNRWLQQVIVVVRNNHQPLQQHQSSMDHPVVAVGETTTATTDRGGLSPIRQQPTPTIMTRTNILFGSTLVAISIISYIAQITSWYKERYRTIRQEQLLERQLLRQQQEEEELMNRTSNNDSSADDNNHPQQQHNIEFSSLSSDMELLPVPLLPKIGDNGSILKSIRNGYCPICHQSIHHNSTSAATTTTMLFGYVYCSYQCIYDYLQQNDRMCPITGNPVTVFGTSSSSSSRSSLEHPPSPPPQLIRLV